MQRIMISAQVLDLIYTAFCLVCVQDFLSLLIFVYIHLLLQPENLLYVIYFYRSSQVHLL
jgi:hypothetical protein